MQTTALILLALFAGVVAPLQAGINSRLSSHLDSSLAAAFVSFLVGTLVLGAYLAFSRTSLPVLPAVRSAPSWVWLGGFLGAFFVSSTIFLAPRLGAGAMIALLVAGQMGASLILDNFALVGYPHEPITLTRLFGAALLVAGVVLIRA